MSFADLLQGAERLPDGLRLTIPESWHQGRTAYGGFSSALALNAAMRAGGEDLAPLRSAQLAMIAPVAGTATARATVRRRGRNATWIDAQISGEGGLGFTASFVFMGPVASVAHLNRCALPDGLVPVAEAPPLPENRGVSFLRNHFEIRFALSPAGEEPSVKCWWVRLAARDGLDPMTEALLVADALPPGVMGLVPRATPISTMHWQVNLLTPAPATRDGWWLLRSRGDYAEMGCSSQRMDMWNADGEPVLAGLQSVALFG